jgi:malate dehydrogenase (oxaloacetate-decarboxylating)(NADP+)
MCDSNGVIYLGRTKGMNPYKERFAARTETRTLEEALEGADVFFGLSAGNCVTAEMIKGMAPNPIIFAMANPDPEIRPELAKEARSDVIIATGRSDYPNQVNNVLGFPFIFRGALDVRARAINDDMKFAASQALAALAKEDVPDSVLRAYGVENIKFGREYIIPKPFDPRVLLWEAPAVAEAAMQTDAARVQIDLDEYRERLALRMGLGRRVRRTIINKAKAAPRRIVFPEGENPKIIRAATQIIDEAIGTPILLGRPEVVARLVRELGLHVTPEVLDPASDPNLPAYAEAYFQMRQRKGVSARQARASMSDPSTRGSRPKTDACCP